MTSRSPPCIATRAAGFSLVEVMVGLVIGMIGMVVMLQIFSVSEGNRRTTTGGDDAQNNGAIAMYGLQSDIRQSGYGNSSVKLLGCNLLLRAGVTLNAIAPVTINHASIPAGDANTDTLLTVSGNSIDSPEGDNIIKNTVQNQYEVTIPSAFRTGDNVIVAPFVRATPCALALERIVNVTATVNVTTGIANVGRGTLFNLGRAPRVQAYAIRGGNLTVCDYMVNDCSATPVSDTVWTPIAANVVSLRAEYARDTSVTMDAIVDADGYSQATPTTACGWARVSAVRFALVARSGQYEKNDTYAATSTAPTWAGTASTTAVPIDLSGYADWQHYRYKTFRLIVPIRNVATLGVPTIC